MRTIVLLLASACAAAAQQHTLTLARPAEVVAELELSSPGSDWAVEGREAALADVALDGSVEQQVMLYAGAARHTYRIFLGKFEAGEHRLAIAKNEKFSAQGSGLQVHGVKFREVRPGDSYYDALVHAPVLYARENTVGRFTDVPITLYCERLRVNGKPLLQYTMIFSNEDGGTSTRALMARWGRTTDIEYIYRNDFAQATIQTKDHKEVPFDGRYFGSHPILMPITNNNMVGANATSAIRYQIAPVEADLASATRESVMDSNPVTWTVMAKELIREQKLRPFGKVDGESISDPRNYLYIDARTTLKDGAVDFLVRLKGERQWRSSSLGRPDFAIARDGWVRTTVELPPGTKLGQIEEFGFACHTVVAQRPAPQPHSGACRVEEIDGAFLLDGNGLPGERLKLKAGFDIPSGITWTLPSK